MTKRVERNRWWLRAAIAVFAAALLAAVYLVSPKAVPGIEKGGSPSSADIDKALAFAKSACLADPKVREQQRALNTSVELEMRNKLSGLAKITNKDIEQVVDEAIPADQRAGVYEKMRGCIKERLLFYFDHGKDTAAGSEPSKLAQLEIGQSRTYIEQNILRAPIKDRASSILYDDAESRIAEEMSAMAKIRSDEIADATFTYATYKQPAFNIVLQFDSKNELNGYRLERNDTPDEQCKETDLQKAWPFRDIFTKQLCFDKIKIATLFGTPASLNRIDDTSEATCRGSWNRTFNNVSAMYVDVICFRRPTVHADNPLSYVVRIACESAEFEGSLSMEGPASDEGAGTLSNVERALKEADMNTASFNSVMKHAGSNAINVLEVYRGVASYLS